MISFKVAALTKFLVSLVEGEYASLNTMFEAHAPLKGGNYKETLFALNTNLSLHKKKNCHLSPFAGYANFLPRYCCHLI